MANAKTYNELNQASAVNASDKVALAQENQAELVTTTVGDLANAVGELNQAGALAELSLATSIGKNLLAQRLNEKGVECAPTDTLVSMADKVNNLVIDGQKTALIGKLITAVENTNNSKRYTFQYCNAKKGQMADVIILDQAANTLSYVRNGDYNTIDAAILAATSTITLPAATSTSRVRALGISQNEKFLITDIDDNKLHIYEIDKVAGTLTLKHDITTIATVLAGTSQSGISSLQSLSVTNDGDKYVFWNAQGGTTIGSVSLTKELNASWSSFYYNQLFFIEGTDFVGITPNSSFGYRKIKYDFDTETVQTFQGLSGNVSTAFFEPRSQLLVSSYIENENTSTSIYSMGMFHRITLYSPENMLSVFSARVQNICAFYGGTSTVSASVTGVQFQVANNGDGTFSWICPIYGKNGVLEYNKNTGAFSVNSTIGLQDSGFGASYASGKAGGLILFAKESRALRVDTANEGICGYGMAIGFEYQRHFTFTDKDYFLGVMQKSVSTGKTGVFNMRCAELSVLPDLLATGVLDVDTPSVEI
nr:MAG TPA: hypothetical protein [Bacteriophage sp.]